tara:strand:- start:247 stop:579 length:333 start_codon:yes stop_codon:yes gene_type:complete
MWSIVRRTWRQWRLTQERLELGFENACKEYGFKKGSPQYKQCIVTERRHYETQQTVGNNRRTAITDNYMDGLNRNMKDIQKGYSLPTNRQPYIPQYPTAKVFKPYTRLGN